MKIQSFTGGKPAVIIVFTLLCLSLSALPTHAQTLGDVNTDGDINIIDALLVARYYVNLPVQDFDALAADVDGDNSIGIVDALLIAQFYVGLITSFPAGTPTPTPGTGSEPKAKFTISNIVPGVNETVIFNASGSSDPDGTIVSYEWDFKDGSKASGVQVTHAFSEIDDYNVKLIVTDNDGLTDDKSERVFIGRPQGWTEKTHHKSADADYDLLFPTDSVPRIDIFIDPADFQAIENNVNSLSIMSPEDPMYVPVTVEYNGYTWWHVGFRYKGQSTLFMPRMEGKKKMPFRLNFDKFEDNFPEIDNQRFYGFSEMTFANNWYDPSFLRDRLCGEIFRDGGIPAARGGFCRIYIDTGNGMVYWGLYSMIEDPSDQMLTYQFEDDTGNLYKPEGTGAEFSSFSQSAYTKKTNEDNGDYSDIQAVINALNAPRNNAASWRSGLEGVFNVEEFLRWLAINTGIVNFDTYGWVTKNYYVYQDLTDNGRMVWIPWDMNLSLSLNNPWSVPIPSLSLDEITTQWPLIRYLMDDPVYRDFYHQEMRIAMDGCFNESAVRNRIQQYANLIRSYVESESSTYSYLTNGVGQFDQAVNELLNHVSTRRNTVWDYLNSH
ncbi:MAG: CotH kinase family protein [Spirochaetales bacterium]|nr:CotH kinase family protein [Spirochaetales bacterium]